jgi:hypothetical protein
MRLHSRSGAVQIAVLLLIAGAIAIGGAVWKASHFHFFASGPSPAKITAQVQAVDNTQAKLDTTTATARDAEQKAHAEQLAQTKQGQQYVDATGQAIKAAAPEAQADPAIQLAGKLNDKAAGALAQAAGALTAEQKAWVSQLIRDATSASEDRRAAADKALSIADEALRQSASRERGELERANAAREQADKLAAEKKLLQEQLTQTLSEKSVLGEAADGAIRGLLYIGIAYVVIAYLLPLLALAFPMLKPIEAAAHAILAPFAAKAKADAEGLAQDACAGMHHLGQLIATEAPQIAAKAQQIKSEWLTEADGTAARAEAALRQANVL